jgi:hypothetical protein
MLLTPVLVSLIVLLHTAYSSTLKTEATGSSETLLNVYETAWLHVLAPAVFIVTAVTTTIHTIAYRLYESHFVHKRTLGG